MKITETYWKIKCSKCGKEKKVNNDPYSETYICVVCLKLLEEPIIENGDFPKYIRDLSNWESNVRELHKKSSYDYGNFKKDLFKHFGVKGAKAEKAYNIAYDQGHSCGYSETLSYFEELVELIK